MAIPFSLGVDDVDAKSFIRSGAGGVTVACAAVLIAGAFVESLSYAALVLAITIMGGLVFGRMMSWRLDGKPGMFTMISGGGEALGFVFGVFWLWLLSG